MHPSSSSTAYRSRTAIRNERSSVRPPAVVMRFVTIQGAAAIVPPASQTVVTVAAAFTEGFDCVRPLLLGMSQVPVTMVSPSSGSLLRLSTEGRVGPSESVE